MRYPEFQKQVDVMNVDSLVTNAYTYKGNVCVVIQLYPWFKFGFPLFWVMVMLQKCQPEFQTSFKWGIRLEGMSEIQVTKMEKSISHQRQNWSPTTNTFQTQLHLIFT